MESVNSRFVASIHYRYFQLNSREQERHNNTYWGTCKRNSLKTAPSSRTSGYQRYLLKSGLVVGYLRSVKGQHLLDNLFIMNNSISFIWKSFICLGCSLGSQWGCITMDFSESLHFLNLVVLLLKLQHNNQVQAYLSLFFLIFFFFVWVFFGLNTVISDTRSFQTTA